MQTYDETEWIFDLEADGLLNMPATESEASLVWCGVFRSINDRDLVVAFKPDEINNMLEFMNEATHLVGHNIVDYDLPLLERLFGWEPDPECELFDTFIGSQLLNPDRFNKQHGLAVWGEHFGVPKPIHEDWSKYSDDMLNRCTVDTDINWLTYHALMKELKDV